MAPRERDDAMAGLLRREFAGGADEANDCPAPDILAAYFERSLDAGETGRCELHFSRCSRCREQLAALTRAEETPGTRPEGVHPAARGWWMWNWVWLAPVAAVLVLAIVWAARRPAPVRLAEQPAQQPLIAMSRPEQEFALRQSAPESAAPQKQIAASPKSALTASASRAVRAAKSMEPAAADTAVAVNGLVKKSETTSPEQAQSLQSGQSVNLPLNGRNYVPPDNLAKSANANGEPAAGADKNAAGPRSASETVTTQAAVSGVAPSAPRPMAAQPVRIYAGGVAGGAVSSAAPQAAQAKEKRVDLPDATRLYSSQSVAVQAADQQITSEPVIHTPDPKILWRIAGGGFVERSEDGGATWHGQLPDSNARVVAGSAPGAKICWLVGDNGIILLTMDAMHWRIVAPPVRADLAAVMATDASSAVVTVADGRKFATSDRGRTWAPAP